MRISILFLSIVASFVVYGGQDEESTENNRIIVPEIMVITETQTSSTGSYNNKAGRKIINQGSPNQMFAGAKLNKNLPRLAKLKKLFERNSLLSMSMYVNKSEEINSKEYKDRQTPTGKDQTKDKVSNKFIVKKDGPFVLLAPKDESLGYPGIIFKELDSGKLEVVGIGNKAEKSPARLVNYSFSRKKNASSYLLEVRQAEGWQYLVRLDFLNTINKKVNLENADKEFAYLYGPGVKVRWPKADKINLNLCASLSPIKKERYLKPILTAVETWNTETDINIAMKVMSRGYPPINDLDTQCIYLVEGFSISKSEESFGTPAFVFPVGDLDSRQIIDADVVILGDVYDSYNKILNSRLPNKEAAISRLDKILTETMVHELGHFLGLAHQFDGTVSIMSYSEDAAFSVYDRDAINNLYSN